MKMYAMRSTGEAGRLLAEGDTLADLTYAHHGSRHGTISVVERVGGGRHHRMLVDTGRSDALRMADQEGWIPVLLPGDTGYPKDV